jgi:hypothetical protein
MERPRSVRHQQPSPRGTSGIDRPRLSERACQARQLLSPFGRYAAVSQQPPECVCDLPPPWQRRQALGPERERRALLAVGAVGELPVKAPGKQPGSESIADPRLCSYELHDH